MVLTRRYHESIFVFAFEPFAANVALCLKENWRTFKCLLKSKAKSKTRVKHERQQQKETKGSLNYIQLWFKHLTLGAFPWHLELQMTLDSCNCSHYSLTANSKKDKNKNDRSKRSHFQNDESKGNQNKSDEKRMNQRKKATKSRKAVCIISFFQLWFKHVTLGAFPWHLELQITLDLKHLQLFAFCLSNRILPRSYHKQIPIIHMFCLNYK